MRKLIASLLGNTFALLFIFFAAVKLAGPPLVNGFVWLLDRLNTVGNGWR